jgi:hypothetical protein
VPNQAQAYQRCPLDPVPAERISQPRRPGSWAAACLQLSVTPPGRGQPEAARDPQHVGLTAALQVLAQLGTGSVDLIAAHEVQPYAVGKGVGEDVDGQLALGAEGQVRRQGTLPSERTLYRLFGRLEAGRHTTGSASTRRSLAARPEGPFGQVPAAAPGDVMQIDSTPLDVLVRLDNGVPDRVDLTGIIDVATRTVTAAVLRPTTKSVDASVLLARTVTPEPMRPGWPQAMRMAASALPFRRMLSIDERLEHAAARPVIIPQAIVVDHGKVFVSESFKASCAFLGISFQPARKATGTDKPHIERMLGSVATMFAQYVSGYTGRSPEYRGRGVENNAVWSLPELQDLLDQWLIVAEPAA